MAESVPVDGAEATAAGVAEPAAVGAAKSAGHATKSTEPLESIEPATTGQAEPAAAAIGAAEPTAAASRTIESAELATTGQAEPAAAASTASGGSRSPATPVPRLRIGGRSEPAAGHREPPGDAVGQPDLWPGVPDPAVLLTALADWLSGYGNRGTRRTYAEGLGLPVTANDLGAWLKLEDPPAGWVDALARYIAALGISHVTPSTHRPPPAARGRLRELHWLRWCASHGQNPLTARSHHVKTWLDALADAGAATATRDRLLATVKACYTHLADTGLIDANPAALNRRRLGLVVSAASTSTTITLTTAQVARLCEAAGTPRRGASPTDVARARAVVTLLTLGLRVSELCGLDRADLHVTRGRRALRVHGKGGKTRIVYLHELADRALADYLRLTQDTAVARRGTTAAPTPLLVTRAGHRFQRQAIWQLLRRLAVSAGEPLRDVADALHPHALRHFYVTTAVEAGAQLVHVQADVGHTSIDTTEGVYNSAARDPGRSAVDLIAAALAENEPDEGR
ncbi:tyrosine-type recombinase/integrase [Amycolatopsis acididurans]|uniref:tyrosine-type recombinase/integrase n=1 Tax=Amycolatopsis acididurans TaxID=2724524 RepID=UPI0028AFF042|nr:tyrosine-type recombinase/integrase [Amycolatopsis acididurans]